MSLSAEYCSDKTGDRGGGGGGALSHQRRLIRGLLIWATLLTLGLATSITLHFIHRESPAPDDPQDPRNLSQQQKDIDITLISFSPNYLFTGTERDMVEQLQWKTVNTDLLRVKDEGLYFLYLQVTLDPHMRENYTITLQSSSRGEILKGLLNKSKLSTGFMGKGIMLNSGEALNVTCMPKAKIRTSHTETYLGVIKLR